MGELMASLAADPARVAEVARTTLAAREDLVTPMDVHARAVADVYRDLITRQGTTP
jgi:hypothetical protein